MKKETRGGNTTTRCTAITSKGHRCSKKAVAPGQLCHLHLRQTNSADIKVDNADLSKLLDQFTGDEYRDLSPRHAMNMIAAAWSGQLTETKSTGGDGELKEVPLSGKDRIAAANIWLQRYPQVFEGADSDETAARRLVERLLGTSSDGE